MAGSRAELVAAEIRLIALHDCITPNGYNLSKGGEGYDSSQPQKDVGLGGLGLKLLESLVLL